MNPVAALLNPVADPTMAASTGPAQTGGNGPAGFADALHRASGSHGPGPSRPEGGPSGSSRHARDADHGAKASGASDDDRVASADDRDDSASEPEAASEPDDRPAKVGRKRIPNNEARDTDGSPGPLATATPVTGARASMEPDPEPAIDAQAATVACAGGPAGRTKSAAAVAQSSRRQGSGPAESIHTPADDEIDSTGPTDKPVATDPTTATSAATLSRQAAALPAGATNIAGTRPVGPSLRRTTGIMPAADRIGHRTPTRTEGAAAHALESRAGRVAPEITTIKDPVPALAQADGGPSQGFEDTLLASLVQGSDPGTAVSTASTPAGTAGGIRPVALPIAAPIHSAAFPQALGQQLTMALRMDLGQAELILSPAELGPVRVELSLDGDSASVHFAAINPETRQALEQSLPNLRALFAEQGLSLADTHVGPGFHRESDDRPAEPAQRWLADRRGDRAIDGEIRPMNARIRSDALVDLFA